MPLQKLEDEVAHLQAVNSELVKDKEEALPLLDAYRSAHNSVCLLLLFCLASCVAMCASLTAISRKESTVFRSLTCGSSDTAWWLHRLSISQLQERQSLDSVQSKTTISRLETQAAKV